MHFQFFLFYIHYQDFIEFFNSQIYAIIFNNFSMDSFFLPMLIFGLFFLKNENKQN